jgi:hypothetical protein
MKKLSKKQEIERLRCEFKLEQEKIKAAKEEAER